MKKPRMCALVCTAAVVLAAGLVRAAQELTPAQWEAELKKLTGERGRVVVLIDTENVFWAIKAANIAGISGNLVKVAKGATTNVAGNIGPRTGILSALRQFTERPSTAPDGSWGLLLDGALVQGFSNVMKEDTEVEIRAIITWWCEANARACTNPPK
jgi:hypothetical protein